MSRTPAVAFEMLVPWRGGRDRRRRVDKRHPIMKTPAGRHGLGGPSPRMQDEGFTVFNSAF